jgi:hypothetical protein
MTYEEKCLRFAEACSRARAKHLDLQSLVMEGHRRFIAQTPGEDQTTRSLNFDLGLLAEPGTEANIKAQLEMVDSIQLIWYQMPDHLKTAIMSAVREVAILRDEDELNAVISTNEVLSNAAGASTHSSKRLEGLKAEKGIRDRKYHDDKRERTRERLNREAMQQ